jgi:hypothetical protein
MTTKTQTKTVKTSELRSGDVVLAHGMRLLIDRPIAQSTAHPADDTRGPVLFTQALVLNRDDVPNSLVPIAWTREWNRSGDNANEHRWTIQGNDLATWAVERPLPLLDMSNPLQASIARARADEIVLASERVPTVHEFESTSCAYDMSQCDDAIHDGDVLVVRSENAVAILLSAWPTAVTALVAGEHFHVPESLDWTRVPAIDPSLPSKSYLRSLEIAMPIIDELSAQS